MKNHEIIEEFIEGTPHWIGQMEEFKEKPCIFCGIIPSKMLELIEAVKELKEKAWMYDDLCK